MKRLFQLLLLVVAMAIGRSSTAATSYEAISDFSSTVNGAISGTVGWTFDVLGPVLVTDLGFVKELLSQGPIEVGLWDQNHVLLAQTTVSLSDPVVNQTCYHAISPVALAPGVTYTIGAYSASTSITVDIIDPLDNSIGGSATSAALIELRGYAESDPNNPVFECPDYFLGANGSLDFGANFMFQIPEPSSLSLLCLAGLSLAGVRRHRLGV